MLTKTPKGALANANARKIDTRKAARALEKIFEGFALDPREPDHWNRLQNLMIKGSYFGRRRRRGRPKNAGRWNSTALHILAFDWIVAVAESKGADGAAKIGMWWPYTAQRRPERVRRVNSETLPR